MSKSKAAAPAREYVAIGSSDFVLINAAEEGRGTVESVRQTVEECFEISDHSPDSRERRLVIFNVTPAISRTRFGWLRNKKVGLKRIGEEICDGFDDDRLIDYCRRNVALFSVALPPKDLLPSKFFAATLERLLFGKRKAPMADHARGSFTKAAAADVSNAWGPGPADKRTLQKQLDLVRGKVRTLELEAWRRLEAK